MRIEDIIENNLLGNKKIGENPVKMACKDLGISQKKLAEYFGVTEKAVSTWANQRRAVPKNFFEIIDLIQASQDLKSLKKTIKID